MVRLICIARLVASLCILLIAAPRIARGETLRCAFPRLHPSLFLLGSLAGVPGRPAASWIALDRQGDIVWSEQAGPPAAGRLFAYDPQTSQVRQLSSVYANSGEGIGLIGVSPRWIVFSIFANRFTGADWQIIVRDQRNGQEWAVASSPVGGLGNAQFALDGDELIWVQPIATGGAVLYAENLRTGQRHTLAATTQGAYYGVVASEGHVVWEWLHPGQHGNATDILLDQESGGAVQAITHDGKGAEPALSWPYLAYLARAHFAGTAGTLVVANLRTGHRWQRQIGRDDDFPQITGTFVLYRSTGLATLYSPTSGQRLVLTRPRQYTIQEQYIGTLHLGYGMMVGVGTDLHGHYGLAIFHLHGPNPLAGLLTCGSAQ